MYAVPATCTVRFNWVGLITSMCVMFTPLLLPNVAVVLFTGSTALAVQCVLVPLT